VARFLLVHGAWHGGWCFEALRRELEARRHTVVAPDLPCDQVGLTQLDYARMLGPQPDVVVVGHSLGGLTIPFVEARVRVYLAALLPVEQLDGSTFVEGFEGFLRDEQDRSYWPDSDLTFAKLYPDCTRAQSDDAFARLRRQARIDLIVQPVCERDIVIATLRDAAIDPAWQQRTAQAHGAQVLTLDSGHSPFFTHPVELADLLESVA
jgi:pimeloyl-ACP methyl ester carboxylesterase